MITNYYREFKDSLENTEFAEIVEHKDGSILKTKLTIFEGIETVVYSILDLVEKDEGEKEKKIIYFIGNGGSAAIASHMATDFFKNGNMKAISFNDGSLLTCLSNDFGYEHVFEKPLEMFVNGRDVLFAISSSGRSENILRAVDMVRSKCCTIITLSGFDKDNPLRLKGNYNFYVPSYNYGHVETIHQYICHCILDIINRNKDKNIE